MRTNLINDHDTWLEYSAALKNYVDRETTHQKQAKQAKQAKKQEQNKEGIFNSFFHKEPKVEQKPQKPVLKAKKLSGIYIYGGPGIVIINNELINKVVERQQ